MLQAITMQDFQVIACAALLAEHSMVRIVACQGGNPGKLSSVKALRRRKELFL